MSPDAVEASQDCGTMLKAFRYESVIFEPGKCVVDLTFCNCVIQGCSVPAAMWMVLDSLLSGGLAQM